MAKPTPSSRAHKHISKTRVHLLRPHPPTSSVFHIMEHSLSFLHFKFRNQEDVSASMLSNCHITNKLLYIPSFGVHLTYFICVHLCILHLVFRIIIKLCTVLCVCVCRVLSIANNALEKFGDINIQVKYFPKMECYIKFI